MAQRYLVLVGGGMVHDEVVREFTKHFQTTRVNGLLHSFDDEPAMIFFENDARIWYKYGLVHRDNDQYAILCRTHVEWRENDLRHRDNDKPAVMRRSYDGRPTFKWYQRGLCHRADDKPAEMGHAMYKWMQFGKYARSGGRPIRMCQSATMIWKDRANDKPSCVVGADHRLQWRRGKLLHRDGDKPANIGAYGRYNFKWYRYGKKHRDTGPAEIGARRTRWFIHGTEVLEDDASALEGRVKAIMLVGALARAITHHANQR